MIHAEAYFESPPQVVSSRRFTWLILAESPFGHYRVLEHAGPAERPTAGEAVLQYAGDSLKRARQVWQDAFAAQFQQGWSNWPMPPSGPPAQGLSELRSKYDRAALPNPANYRRILVGLVPPAHDPRCVRQLCGDVDRWFLATDEHGEVSFHVIDAAPRADPAALGRGPADSLLEVEIGPSAVPGKSGPIRALDILRYRGVNLAALPLADRLVILAQFEQGLRDQNAGQLTPWLPLEVWDGVLRRTASGSLVPGPRLGPWARAILHRALDAPYGQRGEIWQLDERA
jgi:hypothetical protein